MTVVPIDGPGRNHTTEEVAERFRTSPSTIRHWRSTGTGPPYFKAGKRFLYPERGLRAWEDGQRSGGTEAS